MPSTFNQAEHVLLNAEQSISTKTRQLEFSTDQNQQIVKLIDNFLSRL